MEYNQQKIQLMPPNKIVILKFHKSLDRWPKERRMSRSLKPFVLTIILLEKAEKNPSLINFDLLKFIMAWFQRMKIDVAKLIAMVESMPCLWDPTCPDYMQKNKRMDCWGTICAELFPQWHEADAALQHKIELDVRKRWRSVKDRFHKIRNEGMKSGSSPKKPNFIYYDELSFLCTSRKTRETSGNVAVQTPVDDEEGQESLLQPHQEGPSANIDQFSSEHEGDIESGTVQDKSPPIPTIITSGPTKYIKPNNKKKNTKNIQLEEDVICNETLKLLNTSAKEDDIDHFGISIAELSLRQEVTS
ncbi:uncharacterized protein ACNLHF_021072 [Anomaloglossus baeobatrachus]|uniref:uncharacterized protein LOC142312684 n=1 Tax=Anomaloglossus baeobatrachus TaxID=238106 RepID=UPI003F50A2B4